MCLEGLYERERERRRLIGVYERECDEGEYDRLLLLLRSLDLDLERAVREEGDEDEEVEYLRRLLLRLSGSRTVVTTGGC